MPLCFEYLNRQNEILLAHLPYQIFLMIINEYEDLDTSKADRFFFLLNKTHWCRSEDVIQIIERTVQISGDIMREHKNGRLQPDIAGVGHAIKLVSHLLTATELSKFEEDIYRITKEIIKVYLKKTSDGININLENSTTIAQLKESFSSFHFQTTLKKRLTELPIQIFYLISYADGTCDKKEREIFTRILKERSWSNSHLADAFFPQTIILYEGLLKKHDADKIEPDLGEVQKTMQIVAKVFNVNELRLFRRDLFALAMEIAKASGGFLGISSVDDKEQEVLNKLRVAFRGEVRTHFGINSK